MVTITFNAMQFVPTESTSPENSVTASEKNTKDLEIKTLLVGMKTTPLDKKLLHPEVRDRGGPVKGWPPVTADSLVSEYSLCDIERELMNVTSNEKQCIVYAVHSRRF